ncbi:MAG: alpha/beta hydrolase [Bacteroidetes bacterium]|nr:alpha/beta hydrolase [Bacteroidota bacterium]MBS1932082.1 alpha/beta hydrolase [Bacteroidota bacterium]
MTNGSYFKTGYSVVNGINMYYEIHGMGEPLVLIHGGGSTIETSFGKMIPLLRNNFRIIAVELQGHGHTDDRNAPESFEQDADDIACLLHNLKIPKASFFGFSNGGNTSIQIVNRHPGIVNKLIIASTFYKREGFPPGFFDGMKNATLNDMPQPLRDAFLEITPDSNKLFTMFTKDRDRMLRFTDWSDDLLRSIKNPTLILSGDKDVINCGHVVTMSNLIPNSRLMIIPSAHGSYMGAAESPSSDSKTIELTAAVIKDFLNTKE